MTSKTEEEEIKFGRRVYSHDVKASAAQKLFPTYGATPIGWEEEWSRIEPVLAGLMSSVSRLKSFKISDDLFQIEAMFLGQAGLLTPDDDGTVKGSRNMAKGGCED